VRVIRKRPSTLDLIGIGVLLAGVLCVVTGLLPVAEAEAGLTRVAPLLLFLSSVVVLATLAREAGLFDVIAVRIAVAGRGGFPALFALCVLFATTMTALLNLDTTAVLLTPVLLALAPRTGIPELPLAMTTIWLANTASLLLPISNLTNLLAADRVGLDVAGFAGRMWLPQLVAVLATALFLWVFFWRRGERGTDRYRPPPPFVPPSGRRRPLLPIAAAACGLFAVAVPFVGDGIGWAAAAAALVLVAAFAVLDRERLRLSLVPWRLLVLVTGLFLVVPALSRHGLADVVTVLTGTDPGLAGVLRAATTGAGLSNVLNNLPAYTAGEAVVPVGNTDQLLALLIGVNVGSIATPWASLATLVCLETCARHGLRVPLLRFVLTGLGLAVVAVPLSAAALLLTR
jgi:arsenical pump membrane protein